MANPTRSAEALAGHLRVKMISEVLDDDDDRLAVSLRKGLRNRLCMVMILDENRDGLKSTEDPSPGHMQNPWHPL